MFPEAGLDLPAWIGVLQAAEAWGCPPWEVTGETPPRRWLWFMRRAIFESEKERGKRDAKTHHG